MTVVNFDDYLNTTANELELHVLIGIRIQGHGDIMSGCDAPPDACEDDNHPWWTTYLPKWVAQHRHDTALEILELIHSEGDITDLDNILRMAVMDNLSYDWDWQHVEAQFIWTIQAAVAIRAEIMAHLPVAS